MIMDDPEEVAAATPEIPAAAPTPTSPSTRGWTMLEELNESPEAGVRTEPEPDDGSAAAAPTSRGWTMFMEAEIEGEEDSSEEPAAAPAEGAPGFYEGPMTTDAGTVVAFAPSTSEAVAKAKPEEAVAKATASAVEPMSTFASKLRGEEEPVSSFASKLRGEEPTPDLEKSSESLEELAEQATAATATTAPEEAPDTVVPAFAPTSGGFDLKPTAPAAVDPETYEDDEPQKSNAGTLIAVLLIIAVVAVVVYFVVN